MKLEELIGYALSPAAGGLIGWLAGRRRNNAMADKEEVEGVKQVIDIYRKAAEDIEKKYDSLKRELEAMRRENNTMRQEIQGLRRVNGDLQQEIRGLKELISQKT